MYADCLLKDTSSKDNKYVVNQKLEQVNLSETTIGMTLYLLRVVACCPLQCKLYLSPRFLCRLTAFMDLL